MAYYNGFPATYQPMYQQQPYQAPAVQQPQPAYQAQQNNVGITLVQIQGEAAAKSYLVAPNTTVQLWDIEQQVIYIKSADASGMPTMKILDYKIRGEAAPTAQATPKTEYATKDELNALAEKIRDMRDELAGIGKRRSKLMKEEDGDE